MRRSSRSGFTLVELVVSLGILGLVMILYAASNGVIGKYVSKGAESEKLQADELRHRLDFAIESRFKAALNYASDPLLIECLTIECTKNCNKQSEWKPIAWRNIPLYSYKHSFKNEWIYVPSAHLLHDWEPCAPLPKPLGRENDPTIRPEFPKQCRGFSSAHWRSASDNAAEIQITLSVPDSHLSRTIRYYVPFATQESGIDCAPKSKTICTDPNTSLLKVDPDKGTALCGDPANNGI